MEWSQTLQTPERAKAASLASNLQSVLQSSLAWKNHRDQSNQPHPSPNPSLSLPGARHLQKEYRLDQGSPNAKEKAYCAGSRLSIIVARCCKMSHHTIFQMFREGCIILIFEDMVCCEQSQRSASACLAYSKGVSTWKIPPKIYENTIRVNTSNSVNTCKQCTVYTRTSTGSTLQ